MLPRNDLRGVNRMFCSVYKYGCASVAFSFGEVVTAVLVLTCRFSCLQKKGGGEREEKKEEEKKGIISHFVNQGPRCETGCHADSTNMAQEFNCLFVVIRFRASCKRHLVGIFPFSLLSCIPVGFCLCVFS